jgi:hypothetical protein
MASQHQQAGVATVGGQRPEFFHGGFVSGLVTKYGLVKSNVREESRPRFATAFLLSFAVIGGS